jgi:F-type H+-transporting ATPase subunit b
MLLSLIVNNYLLAAAPGGTPWWSYPGFEVWRYFNLFLFIGALVYILRRPIGEALRTRREGIRRDLMRAQEERNAALAKLEEVDARLAQLDAEVAAIREQAQREAAAEHERIARSTEDEARKLREQAQREIENAGKAARADLRRYAAEQSVLLAEEMIRREMRPEDDARLMQGYVEDLGGIRR